MKKSLLMLPTALLAITVLSGCPGESKGKITFGTYINDTAIDITYNGLLKKMEGADKGESFLLAMYYGKDSHCSCWANFRNVLNNYVKEKHTVVYTIDRFEFSSNLADKAKEWGLTLMEEDTPYFYIYKESKLLKQYVYNRSAMFSDLEAFTNEVARKIDGPSIYKIDQEYLDNMIFTEKKDAIVHYMWDFCPDCQYCSPEFLWPYADANKLNKPIYEIDIGELTGYNPKAANPFENFNTGNPTYTTFLADHELSNAKNLKLGYGRGFVPTTQYWKNGSLEDMSVYFNDTVSKVGDKYVVTDSYYTEERKGNLHYLDGVKNPVLKDMEIPESDLLINGDSISWKKDAAAKYHNPLLKAFLDKYAK